MDIITHKKKEIISSIERLKTNISRLEENHVVCDKQDLVKYFITLCENFSEFATNDQQKRKHGINPLVVKIFNDILLIESSINDIIYPNQVCPNFVAPNHCSACDDVCDIMNKNECLLAKHKEVDEHERMDLLITKTLKEFIKIDGYKLVHSGDKNDKNENF